MPDDKLLGYTSGNVYTKHYRYVIIIRAGNSCSYQLVCFQNSALML